MEIFYTNSIFNFSWGIYLFLLDYQEVNVDKGEIEEAPTEQVNVEKLEIFRRDPVRQYF